MNGGTRQKERTSGRPFKLADVFSFTGRQVTLEPGGVGEVEIDRADRTPPEQGGISPVMRDAP